jgi:hypothetical protein
LIARIATLLTVAEPSTFDGLAAPSGHAIVVTRGDAELARHAFLETIESHNGHMAQGCRASAGAQMPSEAKTSTYASTRLVSPW